VSPLRSTGFRAAWRLRVWAGLALLACVLTAVGSGAPPAHADPGDIGYQDFSFSGTSTPTGTKRAESVLWFNDGSWWADMWSPSARQFRIFRLVTSTQTWSDTGVTVDSRSGTHADVLWDGTHLYVASHVFVADGSAAASGYPSYLFRFSYDAGAQRYSLDAGFPVLINNYKTETLVIDKDSTGKLWATWQQGNQIYVNRTVGGDQTWGTPFALPVNASNVTVDDSSAVIAFGGNKIGVMWGNQSSANDAMWFAVHHDGDPDTAWDASRTAIQGPNTADDHMNLKSLQTDAGGRVYAAVKTSFTSSTQPLIMLLVRDPVTGDWSSYPIARVSDCPNRPIVLIDEENRVLHAFFTAPGPPNFPCNSSGGAIYEKTSSLDAISFPLGSGTPVIEDADSPYVHNVSSTKQNVNSATGIALLAVHERNSVYWHAYLPITPSGPPSPPTADFAGSPTSGTAPLAVSFTDLSTGSPTSWSWNFGDGGTSTLQSPTHTYSTPGGYTVSLTVGNASGSDTKSLAGYIGVTPPPAPTANFVGSPTSGTAPLAVSFTDLSTGSPTSRSWNFGDGGTSTLQNPTHTYTTPGSYTVSLTVGNASGSDTKTVTNYVSVAPPPPDFTVSIAPASAILSRGGSTTFTVTLTPLNNFSGAVALSVSGLPSGATNTFDVNPVNVPSSTTSKLTVATADTTKQGVYVLTVAATGGGISHTTTVSLQVKRK
jgi:PKD repeat protein